ncbi:MAG: hypothetical protein SOZ99_10305, partial [Paraeggerthella sp.]|nr:hypothetical protein [Paraeggerthella sp.]
VAGAGGRAMRAANVGGRAGDGGADGRAMRAGTDAAAGVRACVRGAAATKPPRAGSPAALAGGTLRTKNRLRWQVLTV